MFCAYFPGRKLAWLAAIGLILPAGFALTGVAPAQATGMALHSFNGTDGSSPNGPLIADARGALYGTTTYGGTSANAHNPGYGAVFKLTPPASGTGPWTETVLYNFTGLTDGGWPWGGLIFDAQGCLYGTTYMGGSPKYNYGVVYKLTPPASGMGQWKQTILHTFDTLPDVSNPQGGLIFDASGSLYGTASAGGMTEFGAVFKLKPPVSGSGPWTESILYNFNGGSKGDGAAPTGELIFDAKGALYGTTVVGGDYSYGAVYKLAPGLGSWKASILYEFTGYNGRSPIDGVIMDKTGALYGATYYDGPAGAGTVFKLTQPPVPNTAWSHEYLRNFAGINMSYPSGPLISDAKGTLYGTVREGRTTGGTATHMGAVFSLTPPASGTGPWTLTAVHYFGNCTATGGCSCSTPGGCYPTGGVIMGADGALYGTTAAGGPGQSNNGAVYKLVCNQWSGAGANKTCLSW